MPEYNVEITRRETVHLRGYIKVTADDQAAAQAKVEALLEDNDDPANLVEYDSSGDTYISNVAAVE